MAHPDYWRTSNPSDTSPIAAQTCDGFEYAEALDPNERHKVYTRNSGDSKWHSATISDLYDSYPVDPLEPLKFWKAFE